MRITWASFIFLWKHQCNKCWQCQRKNWYFAPAKLHLSLWCQILVGARLHKLYKIVQDCTKMCKIVQDCTKLYQIVHDDFSFWFSVSSPGDWGGRAPFALDWWTKFDRGPFRLRKRACPTFVFFLLFIANLCLWLLYIRPVGRLVGQRHH